MGQRDRADGQVDRQPVQVALAEVAARHLGDTRPMLEATAGRGPQNFGRSTA